MAIPNPVPGSARLTDNFGACRGHNCERRHKGLDIFAPRGTPIYAPISGKVVKVGNDGGKGGNRVWVVGDDGYAYYFAHLDRIIATAGQAVKSGTQLGTVGDTGDAKGGATHLHFSINHKVGAENPAFDPFAAIDETLRFGQGAIPLAPMPPGQDPPNAQDATRDTLNRINDQASGASGCSTKPAILKMPKVGVGIGDIGGGTIISACQGQAVVGALALTAGGILMLAGALVLTAYSLKSIGVSAALRAVPGTSTVAGAVTPSGRAASQQAQDAADLKASEQSARMASAQDRQEASERRMIARRTPARSVSNR